MCDCYYHKCEECDTAIPMHIRDFDYPREDFKIWCHKHITNAEPGSLVFTVHEVDSEDEVDGIFSGWKCAIKGPRVGNYAGNHPNICSETEEVNI